MNANKTSNAWALWEGLDVAPRKKPERWVVTVGYYTSAEGDFLLVPVLYGLSDEGENGQCEWVDRLFVGPVYRQGEPGFDLLCRAACDFLPLFSDAGELPRPSVDESQRTDLVLLVGPDKVSPEWVTVGVWDRRALHAVGVAFRFSESEVANWLWTAGLPRVAAYASPETVREELAAGKAQD